MSALVLFDALRRIRATLNRTGALKVNEENMAIHLVAYLSYLIATVIYRFTQIDQLVTYFTFLRAFFFYLVLAFFSMMALFWILFKYSLNNRQLKRGNNPEGRRNSSKSTFRVHDTESYKVTADEKLRI